MKRAFFAVAATAMLPLFAHAQTTIDDFRVAGVRVIHKPIAANDVIAARLYLKGGSAALTPATEGIEALIAETSVLGTQKYDKDQFDARSTSTGTNVDADATREYTVYSLRAVRANWAAAWDLFAQAVAHPTFPKGEVELARARQVNELKQRSDDPDNYLTLLGDSVSFAGHPFARDPQGTPESVAKLTSDDLVSWHRRRLTKANIVLVVVGNVSRAELTTAVASAFSALPAVGGEAASVPALAPNKPSLTVVERELPTNYIKALYVSPSRSSADLPALQLATRVLSDRLFEEVRTKRNMTYAVGAGLTNGLVGRGNLYVTAVAPDTTLKVILSEVRRLQREPIPRARLQETLNDFATTYWLNQETNMGQAQQLGVWELTGGGWRNALTFVDRMRAVTPAQIQTAATKYMRNARFVVVGDPKKIDRKLFVSM